MDPVRAERMSNELRGKRVGGWLIRRYIGSGKSAVVFEGEKDGQQAALKVFDPELVERFGKPTQLRRIERECRLIGEHHQNLVKIFDGGECAESSYLYVAMEFIDAPNLGSVLTLAPREKIAFLLHQIASAARFLEEKQLAHRDIKPDNIAVFPYYSQAVLLDLGVLRPFGDPSLTDDDARLFVGTTRYSSPEFLLRNEEDTPEGWRAITFYQLGGVLHDLIMRRPLFKEFSEPLAVLVKAVESVQPEIRADDVPADLVLLAQNCLIKQPEARLALVSWNDFDLPSGTRRSAESVKERVKKRTILARTQAGGEPSTPRLTAKQISQHIAEHLNSIIRFECTGGNSFPPIQLIKNMDGQIQVRVIFAASPSHALPQPLSIRFDCEVVDEETMTLRIAASACLLPYGAPHDNPPAPANVFRGPLDSNALPARIQDVLWCAIDLAQRQALPLRSGGDACWVNLVQELEGQL
jgi:serine/threonine protein kinase